MGEGQTVGAEPEQGRFIRLFGGPSATPTEVRTMACLINLEEFVLLTEQIVRREVAAARVRRALQDAPGAAQLWGLFGGAEADPLDPQVCATFEQEVELRMNAEVARFMALFDADDSRATLGLLDELQRRGVEAQRYLLDSRAAANAAAMDHEGRQRVATAYQLGGMLMALIKFHCDVIVLGAALAAGGPAGFVISSAYQGISGGMQDYASGEEEGWVAKLLDGMKKFSAYGVSNSIVNLLQTAPAGVLLVATELAEGNAARAAKALESQKKYVDGAIAMLRGRKPTEALNALEHMGRQGLESIARKISQEYAALTQGARDTSGRVTSLKVAGKAFDGVCFVASLWGSGGELIDNIERVFPPTPPPPLPPDVPYYLVRHGWTADAPGAPPCALLAESHEAWRNHARASVGDVRAPVVTFTAQDPPDPTVTPVAWIDTTVLLLHVPVEPGTGQRPEVHKVTLTDSDLVIDVTLLQLTDTPEPEADVAWVAYAIPRLASNLAMTMSIRLVTPRGQTTVPIARHRT